jgi:hypothetical protein
MREEVIGGYREGIGLQVRGTGVNNQGHEWEKYNRKP